MKYLIKFLSLVLLMAVFMVACNDDDEIITNEILFERINSFDVDSPELPQGMVSLANGNVLVSFPMLNELRVYNPETGTIVKNLPNVPSFSFMQTISTGKVLMGSVWVLDSNADPANPSSTQNSDIIAKNGVWIYDPATDEIQQVAQFTPDIVAAHFVELSDNSFLVSNIFGQSIFQFDLDGNVSTWIDDSLLSGDPDPNRPGPVGRPPFPIGIEGISLRGNSIIGVIADYGRIVEIPVNADGSAGDVKVLKEDRENLLGIAHFIFNDENNMIAISGFLSKVWSIDFDANYSVEELAGNESDVVVDTPASIVRGRGDNSSIIYFTNFSFVRNDEKSLNPGLTRIKGVF